MLNFKITPNCFKRNRETLFCVNRNLELTFLNLKLDQGGQLRGGRFSYTVMYGAGVKAISMTVLLGNSELPHTKADWDKGLLIEAIKYYGSYKGYQDLVLIQNISTGSVLYEAEGIYPDDFIISDEVYYDDF